MRFLMNRFFQLGLLVTGLSMGATGLAAQGRFGVGASIGTGSLNMGNIPIIGGDYSGNSFILSATYQVPLNEKGLSLVIAPGIFGSEYTKNFSMLLPFQSLTLKFDYTIKLNQSGLRVPVMITQDMDSWSFGGGGYFDFITQSNTQISATTLGITNKETQDWGSVTNSSVFGILGYVGYDFKWAKVTGGVTMPFSNIYKNIDSKPLSIQIGLSKTF